MSREGDLPLWLSAIHPRFGTPHRAEVVVAAIVVVLTAFLDLRGAIGFSSFGVLLYYFVANVSAFTQDAEHRRYPRVLQLLGAAGCVALAVTVPWLAVVVGIVVLLVGVLYRVLWRRLIASRAA
jgi:APA family basic amino acid/polyamine antiporter